jgi:bleomycin hydrolase
MSKWADVSEKNSKSEKKSEKQIPEEKQISQEDRQAAFTTHQATDDHLMHLTGIVKAQNGTKFYITKNSWDDDSNDFGGYLYMSEQYLRLNTIAIMVHKDAIPKSIQRKLDIR